MHTISRRKVIKLKNMKNYVEKMEQKRHCQSKKLPKQCLKHKFIRSNLDSAEIENPKSEN